MLPPRDPELTPKSTKKLIARLADGAGCGINTVPTAGLGRVGRSTLEMEPLTDFDSHAKRGSRHQVVRRTLCPEDVSRAARKSRCFFLGSVSERAPTRCINIKCR